MIEVLERKFIEEEDKRIELEKQLPIKEDLEEEVTVLQMKLKTMTELNDDMSEKIELLKKELIVEEKMRLKTEVMNKTMEKEIEVLRQQNKELLEREREYKNREAEIKRRKGLRDEKYLKVLTRNKSCFGYEKDSMDRFGDDLTQEVLQYLSLSDKLRLECVSKQWKNAMIAVFRKEFVIELNTVNPKTKHNSLNEFFMFYMFRQSDDRLYEQRLESVLKKCPNITTVRLGMNVLSEMLSLFGRYCPKLKSLSYPCNAQHNVDKVLSFFSQYGRQLEELVVRK